MLLKDSPDEQMLLMGNEAIARGALEAGVAFAAAYPGTPSSEIALQFFQISRESDLYFEYSANEKVALEVTAGAAMCGIRAMATMKHVGVNVASDALMTLAYTGINGALVLVVADDPYMFSSQNEQDTRWYGKLSGLPILEPSTVAEAKEMTIWAFDLSEKLKLPVILRTTTRINHSSGMIALGPLRQRVTRGVFEKKPFEYVCVPAVSRNLHPKLLDKIAKATAISEESPWNRIEGDGQWGIVCNGVSYGYVTDAITELGVADRFRVLRVGFSHPFPEKLAQRFLDGCEKVLVAEEGEPYLQEAMRNCAHRYGMMLPIHGKAEELFSRLYEFDPMMVKKVIAGYFKLPFSPASPIETNDLPEVPARPPNLCPGCPHRATYVAVREVFGDEAIYPTDIGCYTLGLLPPLCMGDFLIAMGAGIGTAGGFARATGRKVVAFIGDSTFFHSGLSPLASAVYNKHDFMVVVLDNGTAGITPRMSEFHGMAQRGGVVESMVLLGEGRGYCIADGEADVLLGFEPSETIRAAKKCGAQSVVITNTSAQPPFTVAMGQARYPDIPSSMQLLAGRVKQLLAFDAAALALQAGSPLSLNMVMLGALARSRATGIPADMFREIVRTKTKSAFAEINLKAFNLGMSAESQI